jgi:putative ATP-dependent endonuclease of OLD family
VAASGGTVQYDHSTQELVVRCVVEEALHRKLLQAYAAHADRSAIHARLTLLRAESVKFISDDDLKKLEVFARRIRGEIFFAHRWLLVEGQCEYLLAHATGKGQGYDLDTHGVAVIDCQNNGNPQSFAALARALGIPWLALFDGDSAGFGYVEDIRKRGFDDAEVGRRCLHHPAGTLEQQLVGDGLGAELRSILAEIGEADAGSLNDGDLVAHLEKRKTDYAAVLARRIGGDADLAKRMPAALRKAIESLKGLV